MRILSLLTKLKESMNREGGGGGGGGGGDGGGGGGDKTL